MKKTGKKTKPTVADLLKSPSPVASPTANSPAIFKRAVSSSSKGAKRGSRVALATSTSPPRGHRAPSNISDLRNFASSGVDDLKRRIDRSHSEILKDLEASNSRLHKRFKMQNQAYQQVMDEAEKEYKKVSERITESRDAMKASYEEFMAEAQASASRACKTSIVELSQSFEKAIDSLRNRYGIPSN
ncbi:hypothetical protein AAZX31_01G137300 [Glycine max]|uniref:Uncharacterized protein n=2 Tax=Glycine subgen. Soja TaxID=1462606 RepID=K7K3Z2_SOYBN|nr:uncharacterized protein LOC102666051 [Glycine max]XP_028223799.1 uncharacterized protein LOC114405493 [Glycine soja]KAG4403597.1 hypothetical protein GLYMA_01G150100v4 [Glycine max]KAG5069525.1 hypothetical protein JHK85_001902 [Glycine max]KAG5089237.1 hypothetical protein JHK86_001849 [Glycine max]KAH1163176.1 hypothetical protein GYH30_001627 [Glycine max]KAH1163177.1 hypothetical protein GYH30_001627 [Glycine max]|eukprot:XP_006573485.1 uncharacterized protein LOC102666051 [Glycine max]